MSTQNTSNVVPGPGIALMSSDRMIGAVLIDGGKLSPEDAERVLRYSKEKAVRFGDAAIALGLARLEDIQQALATQFDYPYLVPGQSDVSNEVVAAWAPFSEQVESLRALRSQLLMRWFAEDSARRMLAVVGVERRDGPSHLAANLAVVFSQMGERTLLIDSNLREPVQHQLFGLKNTWGLSTYLADRIGLEAIQRVPGFVDLSVMTAGPTPPNPSELLGRSTFIEMLRQVSSQYDIVILDTPVPSTGSDWLLISQRAGAAICAARRNRTSMSACEDLASAVKASGAVMVGGVLIDD